MKKSSLIILALLCYIALPAQENILNDSVSHADTPTHIVPPKKPWKAATIGFGINMGVWGVNRFVKNAEFARINWHTIQTNLQTWPVWDTDQFGTNLLAHPYHGSLYFNAARSNGYSFYQSAPFTLAGSLMWEFAMENEPPSRNDLTATTIGGIALGEITFRSSDLILDNRATGSARFWREFLAGAIAPSRLISRLTSGEAWRYSRHKGNIEPAMPVKGNVNFGGRYITDQDESKSPGISFGIGMEYGDVFEEELEKPYEWFQAKLQADLISGSFIVKQVSVLGALRTWELYNRNNWQILGGFFQHFDYFNSKVIKRDSSVLTPYYISEAAALGPGLLVEKTGKKFNFRGQYYINGIALGGSISDHFKIDNRDYNMGSGYSIKIFNEFSVSPRWQFLLGFENYRIFTWKGIEEIMDFKDLTKHEMNFLNLQGDKSDANLYLLTSGIRYNLPKKWHIGFERHRYIRKTSYRYMPDVKYTAWDDFLSVGVRF